MNGFLNLNKPVEWTSRDVVNRVAKLVRPLKAGHAGTLDPLATGVLLVAVGASTRLISYAQEQEKVYLAKFRLGLTSDTDDITGEVVETGGRTDVSRDELSQLLVTFTGRIDQVPPSYSAVHVNGQRAYRMAREGQVVELAAREVDVHEIELIGYDGAELEVRIRCGSGTYIRSIGRDLGAKLGCGAVMTSLVRERIGSFRVEDALDVEQLTREVLEEKLSPPGSVLGGLVRLDLDEGQLAHVWQGRAVPWYAVKGELADGAEVALFGPGGDVAGIGRFKAEYAVVQPKVVLKAGG